MQVLEMLRARVRERVLNSDELLATAANRVAADEAVDHGAVEAALEATGKSVDDFERMVELFRRRRQWHATLDRRAAATTRLGKARAAAEREREQFETIRRQWMTRGAELDAELAAAQTIVDAGNTAEHQLIDPANVPAPLGPQLVEAHGLVDATAATVQAIARELREVRGREKSETEWAEHKGALNMSTPAGDSEDHRRRAARATRRAAELATELATAQAEEKAALAALKRLEAAALKL